MSTIRFWDPVYIREDTSKVVPPNELVVMNTLCENRFVQIRINNKAWSDLWDKTCNLVTNFAEFTFDFGQGACYSITSTELNNKRVLCLPNNSSFCKNLWQTISLIAVIIIFPLGVALILIKDNHHDKVTKVHYETEAEELERAQKASLISLYTDIEESLAKNQKIHKLPQRDLNAIASSIQLNKLKLLSNNNRAILPKSNIPSQQSQRIRSKPTKVIGENIEDLVKGLRLNAQLAILTSLGKELSSQIDLSIDRLQEKALTLNDENNSSRSNELKLSKGIKDDLEALRLQIAQIQEDNPDTAKNCDKLQGKLEFIMGIINEILKSENTIVINQAKMLFGKTLTRQGGKTIIHAENNGSCLFLCLTHESGFHLTNEKKTPQTWADKAFTLRKNVANLIRKKITECDAANLIRKAKHEPEEENVLKMKIRSEMGDHGHLSGYPEDLKKKIQAGGSTFIWSEEENEGWQAYLKSLELKTTFAGDVELSVLPELLQANILVYTANLDMLEFKRDDQNRLHVFCPQYARLNSQDYVYGKKLAQTWLATHPSTEGKIRPALSIPESMPYEKTISVMLRGNHYDLLVNATK